MLGIPLFVRAQELLRPRKVLRDWPVFGREVNRMIGGDGTAAEGAFQAVVREAGFGRS
ncbi:MAG TPA: hypothetical protein VJ487_10355 [Alphaproteobacteria bacterium]|nr:hypothetical protein [Alphaproteobacteria bacterium]